jgi:hypothetical protein
VRNSNLKVYLSKWKGNILTFFKLMVQKTHDMCLSQIKDFIFEDFIFGIATKKKKDTIYRYYIFLIPNYVLKT